MATRRNGRTKKRASRKRACRAKDPLTIALTVENEWVSRHYDRLVRQYPRKIVAISHRQVAGVGETGDEALALAREKYPNALPLLVRVPSPEDLVCVL
ncbi:MAG: hypothetical protein HYY13_00640 [Nitrospirae bacterium]|nr:hypothetical protein [Nitrospirota bacterium]